MGMRFVIELLKQAFRDAILALFISGVICLVRLVFATVTANQFWGGALGVFAILALVNIYNWVRTLLLMRKDSAFKEMTLKTGISWRDYKRLKDR